MPDTTSSDLSGGLGPDHFRSHVVRTFRHTLRGYSPADVDAHLRLVRGWFTLAGFEQLIADHRDEILGSALRTAETTVEDARREAAAMIEQARREADAIVEQARRESQTILDESTQRADATTAAAARRLDALKTLARAILEEADAQS